MPAIVKVNDEHPVVRSLLRVLMEAGGPLRLRDLAARAIEVPMANPSAYASNYLYPLLRRKVVLQVGRGLYCHKSFLPR